MKKINKLASIVKEKRKKLGFTQEELAKRAGVGLRFIRDLEQGKDSLQLNKVDQVLNLFGLEMNPVRKNYENEP
ncbi:MAG TPA: helix-turn-helix transcriptional regulator [Ignavibacteriaceae bacterium]|jgi:y4mF family transcriptional regulator|nr:helix-turn-helix transcriptional regulator [Ignavibacteriaceae bacterium]